jgi:hypothetical protein
MTDMHEQPLPAEVQPAPFALYTEVALICAAATALGTSQKAIRRKIEEGVWLEGYEWHRRDGRIWIDLRGVARWVRGERRAAA